jgi:hypothetical protein
VNLNSNLSTAEKQNETNKQKRKNKKDKKKLPIQNCIYKENIFQNAGE